MNDESASENRESLATSQKDNKKNSPILEALSRHVSRWPAKQENLSGKTKEVQLRKEDN